MKVKSLVAMAFTGMFAATLACAAPVSADNTLGDDFGMDNSAVTTGAATNKNDPMQFADSGMSGTAGVSGVSGVSGAAGVSGSSSVSGATGVSGAAAPSDQGGSADTATGDDDY